MGHKRLAVKGIMQCMRVRHSNIGVGQSKKCASRRGNTLWPSIYRKGRKECIKKRRRKRARDRISSGKMRG